MTQNSILIVDDEVKITEIVRSYLKNSGYHTTCAFSGVQALNLFEDISPDLVILDLMLPDIKGEEICKEIRKKSNVPIIMLTAKIDDAEIINGFKIGADDYITKPFSPNLLVARVGALLKRTLPNSIIYSNKIVLNDKALIIDEQRHEVFKNGEKINLTPNEFKILLMLAKHSAKAFSREELIKYCLGDDYQGLKRVIDTHIKSIRNKLGDNGKTYQFVQTVHGIGYKIGMADILKNSSNNQT